MSDFRRQRTYSEQYLADITFDLKRLESDNFLNIIGDYLRGKKKILDVGCGVGILGSDIKKKYGADVYGIDINKVAVKGAAKFGIKAKIGDIEKRWPYKSATFDAVLIIQVLEHVLDTDNLVLEAKRVLKKGGLLIISTPNLGNWFNRIIFLFGFQPFFTEVSLKDKTFRLHITRRISKNRDTVGHIRVFTLRALKDFLSYYKFRMKFIKGGALYYLPGLMKGVDSLFSLIPSLASDIVVVAEKHD